MQAFSKAEKTLKPNWKEMFTDVYDDVPPHLQWVSDQVVLDNCKSIANTPCLCREQMEEMEKHLNLYKDEYPLKNFEK